MKRFLGWLHRLRDETDPSPSEYERQVRWLSPEETPFGVDVLYCIPYASQMTSMTADQQIARRFGQLLTREDLMASTSPDAREIACDLTYTLREPLAEGPVFRSREMEEKWDIYFYDGQLYCVRSWTGDVWSAPDWSYPTVRLTFPGSNLAWRELSPAIGRTTNMSCEFSTS